MISPELRSQLIDALAESDSNTRDDRADRLVWLSMLPTAPPVLIGRFEQFRLREEARVCFVQGNFIAVVLTALALIEQTLTEELLHLGLSDDKVPKSTQRLFDLAHERGILSAEQIKRAHMVREHRNPLGHFRPPDDPKGPVRRYREGDLHPDRMLEDDAKEAISLAFDLFVQTIRLVKFE
ncbi:hypothetical protein [Roseateles sp. P5_E1]